MAAGNAKRYLASKGSEAIASFCPNRSDQFRGFLDLLLAIVEMARLSLTTPIVTVGFMSSLSSIMKLVNGNILMIVATIANASKF